MDKNSNMMKSIRKRTPALCETFELESFRAFLKKRGLQKLSEDIEDYIKADWITPLAMGNKERFHKGHFLILLRLDRVSQLQYESGVMQDYDFEDVMLRRSLLSDLETADMIDDARRIEALTAWLWSEDIHRFRVKDAVQSKAIIDLTLDEIDPEGFYETLRVDTVSYGSHLIVHDLIAMQAEIGALVGLASSAGSELPNVQHIFERFERYHKIRAFFEPLHSPYLVAPTRNMMADERFDFLKTRNQHIVEDNYQGLVDHYNANLYLFEDDVKRQAELYTCLGNIYGQLLNDNAKAADAFRDALQYAPQNTEAFDKLSHHLREAEDWSALVDLLSNHWDGVESPKKRGEMLIECAKIQAFHCNKVDEAIGLYERCMNDGLPVNAFDDIYKIITEHMTSDSDLQRLRLLVMLSTHVTSYAQSDTIVALQAKYDNNDDDVSQSTSLLIDAGVECFRGDQVKAAQLAKEAMVIYPENTLIDGILVFILSKMHGVNEFNDIMSELEAEALNTETLSQLWLRVARALSKTPQKLLALQYAEHAVIHHPNNEEAVDFSYQTAIDMQRPDRAFVYASLKAQKAKREEERKKWQDIADDLRLSLNDDDSLLSSYESLLQFDGEFVGLDEALKELINGMSDSNAIDLLQRVEARCVANGMAKLVSELYESVLERDIEVELKRGLLERFIGFLLGQSKNIERDIFLNTHAQLYALAPSDHLYTMIQSFILNNTDELEQWTTYLHDNAIQIDDPPTLIRIYKTLADCYLNALKDREKVADTYREILKWDPDNIDVYKAAIENDIELGRHFECVDLSLSFPVEKLSTEDRIKDTEKILMHAFVHLYDPEAIALVLKRAAKHDETDIPNIVDNLIDQAKAAQMPQDEIIGLLETAELKLDGIAALAIRIARVEQLTKEGKGNEAIALLNAETQKTVKIHSAIRDYTPRIAGLYPSLESASQIADYESLWAFGTAKHASHPSVTPPPSPSVTPPPSPSVTPPPSPSVTPPPHPGVTPLPPGTTSPASLAATTNLQTQAVQEKLKTVLNNLDDKEALAALEKDIKTCPAQTALEMHIQIAKKAEENNSLSLAEKHYKRAFAYTQDNELLDFYKRHRQFRKALKILQFQLAKATTNDQKIAIQMDIARSYQQINDSENSLKWLNKIDIKDIEDLEKTLRLSTLELKAALHANLADFDQALELLQRTSQVADPKHRDNIDIDRCLLMREVDKSDDAQKLWKTLVLRGLKNDKMQLLNICFDIDDEKYDEAEKKIERLLASEIPDAIAISTLEQKLRIHTLRNDDAQIIQNSIADILSLDPNNSYAKSLKSE